MIRPQLQADDTFVSLHAYPFDLALYMRAPKPSWVVDDWLNPEIPIRDNWRKGCTTPPSSIRRWAGRC